MSAQTDMLDDRQRWERLEAITIERLRLFEPEDGYVLAYSGGKDSDVLLALAKAAGVKFEAHHHHTTLDPPELVKHVRSSGAIVDRPKRSMLKLVQKKGLPSAIRRWCCSELKERPWPYRVVATGVRAAESARRAQRQMIEPANAGKGQRFFHPLLDWADADIWGYIAGRGVDVCSLYAEGHKRIGCICCPLGRSGTRDAKRWPKMAANLHAAWMVYCVKHPGRIQDPEGMWGRFLAGDLGRTGGPPQGCPLFADERPE